MNVQKLIEHLEQALVAGSAKPTDLVVNAEYSTVHLRPAPDGYVDDQPIVMTREARPL